jgi:hypothetical protein
MMKQILRLCMVPSLTECGGSNVTVIQHVVFILKENRTTDSYFGTFPGVDGATHGVTSTGKVVPLSPMIDNFQGMRLCNGWDCAIGAIDGGKMDRFDVITGGRLDAYSQVNRYPAAPHARSYPRAASRRRFRVAAEFELGCQQRRLHLFVLPPRSPKLNGAVERANRTHTKSSTRSPPARWK